MYDDDEELLPYLDNDGKTEDLVDDESRAVLRVSYMDNRELIRLDVDDSPYDP